MAELQFGDLKQMLEQGRQLTAAALHALEVGDPFTAELLLFGALSIAHDTDHSAHVAECYEWLALTYASTEQWDMFRAAFGSAIEGYEAIGDTSSLTRLRELQKQSV